MACGAGSSSSSSSSSFPRADIELDEQHEKWLQSSFYWAKWFFHRSSPRHLRESEESLLSNLGTPYRGRFVNIGPLPHANVDDDCFVWTISLNVAATNKTPLVLLHGFGCGVGLWCLNLVSLAAHRPVYAIDLPGFGRSSRQSFSFPDDPLLLEEQFVFALEAWQGAVFQAPHQEVILLGHSFGGFLAASFALRFPERVRHLVLVDPWGFSVPPPGWGLRPVAAALSVFNPLFFVRMIGPSLMRMVRPDLIRMFSGSVMDAEKIIPDYLFHANAQNPTGESAFRRMMYGFGWAKFPMIHRIRFLSSHLPVTFMFGSESWVDRNIGFRTKLARPDSFVDVRVIAGAGHHVYADRPLHFNAQVNAVGMMVDGGGDGGGGELPPFFTHNPGYSFCPVEKSFASTLAGMVRVRKGKKIVF